MSTAEIEDVVVTPDAPVHLVHERTTWEEIKRTAALSWTVGLTDWRLRFYGSVLGVLWTLIRPFALFGIIYLVFIKVAKLNTSPEPHLPAYILMAMVMYQYFMEITSASVSCLVDREGLLRKIHFNPVVVPLAVATAATLNVGFTVVAVLIFAVINGADPMWTWIELPFCVAFIMIFAVGVGMLLSALYVRYRDMRPIWDVVGQALFYVSPILFTVNKVPAHYQAAYLCNPLAAVFTQMHHAIIYGGSSDIVNAIGGWVHLLIPIGVVVFTFVLGLRVFLRESPRVAENL